MKKYKFVTSINMVVDPTKKELVPGVPIRKADTSFQDIEMPIPVDFVVGEECDLLGGHFRVSQAGGGVVVLTSEFWNITLQEIIEVIEKSVVEPERLTVNKHYEIFFETKEIQLNVIEDCGYGIPRLTGITYQDLFEALKDEWKHVPKVRPQDAAFIMEHEEGTNNYCFLNGWGWLKGKEIEYTKLLKDGCWSQKDVHGRHV